MSTLGIILLVLLLLVVFGGLPQLGVWKHGYGYGPSGIGGLLLIILVVLLLLGKI